MNFLNETSMFYLKLFYSSMFYNALKVIRFISTLTDFELKCIKTG